MSSNGFPDLTRRRVGTTLFSEWHVADANRLAAAADALLAEWRELSARFTPDAFVRLTCFASLDGTVLLSCSQWRSDDGHLAFIRRHRQDMVDRIDQAVPGIARPGLLRSRVHRTIAGPADTVDRLALVRASGADTTRWGNVVATDLADRSPANLGQSHVLRGKESDVAVLYAPYRSGLGDPVTELPQAGDVRVSPVRHYRLYGVASGPADTV